VGVDGHHKNLQVERRPNRSREAEKSLRKKKSKKFFEKSHGKGVERGKEDYLVKNLKFYSKKRTNVASQTEHRWPQKKTAKKVPVRMKWSNSQINGWRRWREKVHRKSQKKEGWGPGRSCRGGNKGTRRGGGFEKNKT